MKPLRKTFIWFCIFALLVFAGISIWANVFARDLIEDTLSESFKKDVTVAALVYQFPVGLRAYRVKIQDFGGADEVSAQFKIESLFSKRFEIVSLFVKRGKFLYEDYSLENVRLKAYNLAFPLEAIKTRFEIRAQIAQDVDYVGRNTIFGNGWVDVVSRDMKAAFRMVNQRQKDKFQADVVSKNNDVTVQGKIFVDSDDFIQVKTESASAKGNVLNSLGSMNIALAANFSFQTKMDDFKITDIPFMGTISEGSQVVVE